jgi:ABC-type spermidine/putrescine transport system permease subunit II
MFRGKGVIYFLIFGMFPSFIVVLISFSKSRGETDAWPSSLSLTALRCPSDMFSLCEDAARIAAECYTGDKVH